MTTRPHSGSADRKFQKVKRFLPLCVTLAVIAVAIVALSNAQTPFTSVEVAFTDTSAHGMQIVPASCPSNPGDADAPYGCSGSIPLCPNGITPAPNGNLNDCVGATLNTSCGVGYTYEGGQCQFTGCPIGYIQGTDFGSGKPDCAFRSCPQGYTQQVVNGVTQCTQSQCISGNVCGSDGNLYHEDSSCHETLVQTCAYGCAANNCFYPAPSSDIVALPNIVKTGKTANVSWKAANVKSCSVSGTNGDAWSCSGNACAATTTETTVAIEAQTIYTLSCTGLDGSHVGGTATVDVVPNFLEQ